MYSTVPQVRSHDISKLAPGPFPQADSTDELEGSRAQQTLNQGLQLVTPLIGAGLFTVVDYRVLLAVIAVAAAASGLLIITWRRPVAGTARPDAAASDSAAADADTADARNRQEHPGITAS